jgi:hypothetical protein
MIFVELVGFADALKMRARRDTGCGRGAIESGLVVAPRLTAWSLPMSLPEPTIARATVPSSAPPFACNPRMALLM